MQNENSIRVDVPHSTIRPAQRRPAKKAKPYKQFARSGVWRFRPTEPFRPFKPFHFE
jgi:hypothetical protein